MVVASGNCVVLPVIWLQVSALLDSLYIEIEPEPPGKVNSDASTPIRRSRHCRRSVAVLSGLWALPAAMAILGILVYWPLLSPSCMFLGRRNRVAGCVALSGGSSTIGLSAH